MRLKRITLLLFALILFGSTDIVAQVDMDKQLRDRKSQTDTYDDSDRDRLGSMYSFYLTKRLGDKREAWVDTLMLNYFHRAFIDGLSVSEAYTGTQASPYQSKIYFDRPLNRWDDFYFTNPYNHLMRRGKRIQWYDTKTPYTFLKYTTMGSDQDQEQNFTFTFSSNLGKEWSLGGDVDIDNANGFYGSTSSKNITYRVFSYYRGDRYEAYASIGNTNTINQESGGIKDMRYITNPDEFKDGKRTLLPKDIPTKYKSTWNRVVYGSGRLHHKYSLGFYEDELGNRQPKREKPQSKLSATEIPEDTIPTPPPIVTPSDSLSIPTPPSSNGPKVRRRAGASSGQATDSDDNETTKDEKPKAKFIPVTSFFHDFQLEQAHRSWVSLDPAFEKEYPNPIIPKVSGSRYFPNDRFYALKISNSVGVELVEGFHDWAKMGIAAFVAHDYKKFWQPLMNPIDAQRLEIENIETLQSVENTTYVGGRVSSNSFKHIDYYVWGQVAVAGTQAGEVEINGELNTHIPLFKDTVTVSATANFLNISPSYYLRRYKASLHEWEQSLGMIQLLRIGGIINIPKTRTKVFANFETLQNPVIANKVAEPEQIKENVRVLAVGISQSLSWRAINWENDIVWQNSSHQSITPLPTLSVYSNLYLRFLISKVMTLQIGADAKWHTAYYAPYYEPSTQLFRPQEEIKIGGQAPLISVYANAHLKRTKFFVQYYNIGALIFKPNHFSMPNYPLYPPVFRLGIAVDLRN